VRVGLHVGAIAAQSAWLELRLLYLPPVTLDASNHPTASGRFALFGAAVDACLRPIEGAHVLVGVCGGLEVGVATGEGDGVSDPGDNTAVWVAPALSVFGGVRPLGPLLLRLEASLLAPVHRPDFVLEGVGALYRAAPLVARGTLTGSILF
jgi:hypothetical protein